MKCRYITIEREYGSGGTEIAKQLSEQTGIPCYGQEILQKVADAYDTTIEKIEKYEENVSNSFLYSIYMMSQAASGKSDMLAADGHIYVAEQEVIKRLAANTYAIFLGHCASEALKEKNGVINVFIHCSDEKAKRERIIKTYDIPESKVDVVQRKYDKKRANYYNVNTERQWEDFKQYDIVLDSGKLGIDGCVRILKAILEVQD